MYAGGLNFCLLSEAEIKRENLGTIIGSNQDENSLFIVSSYKVNINRLTIFTARHIIKLSKISFCGGNGFEKIFF